MAEVKIGSKTLGPSHPVYVVAEVGINHDGDLAKALDMIDTAAGAGADSVKFQLFRASGMYQRKAGIYRTAAGKDVKIFDLMEQLEMPIDWVPQLMERCQKRDVQFITTVCDEQVLGLLDDYPQAAYKVASYEISHLPLFRGLAKRKKPIIFSSGAAGLSDIEEALGAIAAGGGAPSVLLHCVASYPTPLDQCNLSVIETLASAFPQCVVGYSDHSEEPVEAPRQAVALGACLIEKHFTLDKSSPGADHSFAVNPKGLEAMIGAIRAAEVERRERGRVVHDQSLLGTGSKRTLAVEAGLRKFAYRTLFATAGIAQGEKFTTENVGVLRAGQSEPGIHPRYYETLLSEGARATKSLSVGDPITWQSVLSSK